MHTCQVSTAARVAIASIAFLSGSAALARADDGGPRVARVDENPPPYEEWDDAEKENPKAPDEVVKRPLVRTGYPMELVARPLTLADGMAEASIDMPVHYNAFYAAGRVRVDYGVNSQVQLGLTYGPGALDSETFTTGKAAALEARYLVTNWASVQLAVPMLFDPVAVGVTLGAPLKFSFGGKLAVVVGYDFLSVRIKRFVPLVDNPVYNDAQAALYDTNTTLSKGDMRFLGTLIYQIDADLAFMGETGVVAFDFKLKDSGMPFRATLLYSPGKKVDVGVRVGFDNLDNAAENFATALIAALRI